MATAMATLTAYRLETTKGSPRERTTAATTEEKKGVRRVLSMAIVMVFGKVILKAPVMVPLRVAPTEVMREMSMGTGMAILMVV